MHPKRLSLLAVNGIGGIAVLASYAIGIAGHPDSGDAMWGGVPQALRPLYTVSMLTAAAGYFAFTLPLLFGVDPDRVRIGGRFGFGALHLLYAAILLPSALWMPLTLALIDGGGVPWWSIRLVLAVVGLGSLGLLLAIGSLRPISAGRRRLALAGCAAFCFQTAVLDALVWPAYFPV